MENRNIKDYLERVEVTFAEYMNANMSTPRGMHRSIKVHDKGESEWIRAAAAEGMIFHWTSRGFLFKVQLRRSEPPREEVVNGRTKWIHQFWFDLVS